MPAVITIKKTIGFGYRPGDYCQLHGNSGEGDIDWDTPLDNNRYELFPNGSGIYGWGRVPWGRTRWGSPKSKRTPGWGRTPWCKGPWGYPPVTITAQTTVTECGDYKFGLKVFDAAGNAHTGTPEEASLPVHIARAAPVGLKLNDYDKATNTLTLDVITQVR